MSVQVEQSAPKIKHPSSSIVGGDLGVKRLLALSDGTYFKQIDTDNLTNKIKRIQRKLAKKVRFSNNWKKLKESITTLDTKSFHVRRDRLHKISTSLSKNHAIIVLEDLEIKNMTKSNNQA